MTPPTREEFLGYAARFGVVPVWREVLADLVTPLAVYARLPEGGPRFLLESAEHGERWGRYSFVGFDPFLTLIGHRGQVRWDGDPPPEAAEADGPLAALAAVTAAYHAPQIVDVPLHGGAVGYIGYDAVREVEDIAETGVDDLGMPDTHLVFPRHVIALDHLRQVLTVVTNVVTADTDEVAERISDPGPRFAPVSPPAPERGLARAESNLAPGEYEAMVEAVKEHIVAGDTFQTVVSQRFSVATTASALELYRVLRVINPSPYLYLLDFGDAQVVGSSPEALVQLHGSDVETWPIAGTRPRGADAESDRRHAEDLLADAKERAEHVMLVDLGRNDLGRVCGIGSIDLERVMDVERYSHVMHLSSTVTGHLREGLTAWDALANTLPVGTVSGAPKVRAMQIIDELEPTRRGPYAGGIGCVGFTGDMDIALALRTMVIPTSGPGSPAQGWAVHLQAGAGIVADSDPAEEYEETVNKAAALARAIDLAEHAMGTD